jgi:hypothetical protein
MKKYLIEKLKALRQFIVMRMLPDHTCKYCGCRTKQPDSECYAKPN